MKEDRAEMRAGDAVERFGMALPPEVRKFEAKK